MDSICIAQRPEDARQSGSCISLGILRQSKLGRSIACAQGCSATRRDRGNRPVPGWARRIGILWSRARGSARRAKWRRRADQAPKLLPISCESANDDKRQSIAFANRDAAIKSLTGTNGPLGRGERIRTSGLYVPNVALYQAKLHPDDSRTIPGRESRTHNQPVRSTAKEHNSSKVCRLWPIGRQLSKVAALAASACAAARV